MRFVSGRLLCLLQMEINQMDAVVVPSALKIAFQRAVLIQEVVDLRFHVAVVLNIIEFSCEINFHCM